MLPLPSNVLAQFSTAASHNLHHDHVSSSSHDNITKATSPGSIQAELNENTDTSSRQGAAAINSPQAPSAMNIDEGAHPSQMPVQLPEANCEHGARDVLHDAVASVLETADDAELVGNAAVIQESTQAQSDTMQVTSSTQSDNQSEPREFRADSGAEIDFDAGQLHRVLQGSEPLKTETHQAATPTQQSRNETHELGLQNLVTKLEEATPPTDKNRNSLGSVFFRLYLDEEADPLEPQCCVKLTGLTTRDELFTMMHDDLQNDLDTGDQIVSVKVKRADGEVFRGPNVRTMPIKRVGQQDMWRELINTLLEHGAGEEGLRGYIKVKKTIDVK